MSQLKNTSDFYGRFNIVIDGDYFAYKACSSVQKDINWGDGLYTCHAYLEDAIDQYLIMLDNVKEVLYPDIIRIALSSPLNFRKNIYPDYKANRKNTRKPTCYAGLIEYIKSSEYEVIGEPWFEADDLMGLQASKDMSILVSADKDMNTIPGLFFNCQTNELRLNSYDDAFRNTVVQALSGDRADNYPGIPGYGSVKANKLIDSYIKGDYLNQNEVLKYLESKFGNDFITMYRLAKIVDSESYMNEVKNLYTE